MKSSLFAKINDDYYVRRYELNPELLNGTKVTIYVECAPNVKKINGHHYYFELSFSVDNMGVRDFLIGATFGTGPMSKDQLDAQIDSWVKQVVTEDIFQNEVTMYLKKEKMWEEFLTNEMTGNSTTSS